MPFAFEILNDKGDTFLRAYIYWDSKGIALWLRDRYTLKDYKWLAEFTEHNMWDIVPWIESNFKRELSAKDYKRINDGLLWVQKRFKEA